jgi:hypothetical protein
MFGLGKVRGRLTVTRGVITVADPLEDSRVEAEVSSSGPIAPSTAMRTASMMPGMAARRLSVQITARATRA